MALIIMNAPPKHNTMVSALILCGKKVSVIIARTTKPAKGAIAFINFVACSLLFLTIETDRLVIFVKSRTTPNAAMIYRRGGQNLIATISDEMAIIS